MLALYSGFPTANTEAELKKRVAYKKNAWYLYVPIEISHNDIDSDIIPMCIQAKTAHKEI